MTASCSAPPPPRSCRWRWRDAAPGLPRRPPEDVRSISRSSPTDSMEGRRTGTRRRAGRPSSPRRWKGSASARGNDGTSSACPSPATGRRPLRLSPLAGARHDPRRVPRHRCQCHRRHTRADPCCATKPSSSPPATTTSGSAGPSTATRSNNRRRRVRRRRAPRDRPRPRERPRAGASSSRRDRGGTRILGTAGTSSTRHPLERTVANLSIEMISRPDSLASGHGKAWLTGYERSTMGDLLATVAPHRHDPRRSTTSSCAAKRALRLPGIGAHALVVQPPRGLPSAVRRDRRIDFDHMAASSGRHQATAALANGEAPNGTRRPPEMSQ